MKRKQKEETQTLEKAAEVTSRVTPSPTEGPIAIEQSDKASSHRPAKEPRTGEMMRKTHRHRDLKISDLCFDLKNLGRGLNELKQQPDESESSEQWVGLYLEDTDDESDSNEKKTTFGF